VQIADIGQGANDGFAIELDFNAEHAVGGRMRREPVGLGAAAGSSSATSAISRGMI
jgi:hypothetical protein